MEFIKIKLPFKVKNPVLALGSHTKNTVCFIQNSSAYVSKVYPDLSNPEDFLAFRQTLNYFLKKKPKIIAYDLHPEYASTKYALNLKENYRLKSVSHHHAHIASCMVENNLKNQKVIGIAFDGTGLGPDNTLWGGEFLICDYKSFKRKAYLKAVPLLGGQQAILEPWRITALWLYLIYKDKFLRLPLDFIKKMDKKRWQILKKIYQVNLNCPLSSSMGRLFDAVASLVLVRPKIDYEAQLPIELEKIASTYKKEESAYDFSIIKQDGNYIIEPELVFKQIVSDLKAKMLKERIAYKFHLTVAQMIKRLSKVLSKETGIKKIVLSGGVFQNKLLLNLTLDLLYKEDFLVFYPFKLSCSDAGLSLGQAVIAG